MGKIVTSVLEVGAAIAVLAIPGVGEVLEVGLVSLGVAGATAASIVTATALAVGLSGVESILTKTPSLSNALASNLAITTNAAEPRKIVFGTTAAGSDLRFKESYGKKDDRLALAIALASHRVSAVNSVTLDSVLSWQIGDGGSAIGKNADGYDLIRPVTEGSSSNSYALGTGEYWTKESTFTGCAYLQIVYRLDKTKVWTDGLPSTYVTVVDGCPVYDPRLDSTVGGAGAMRSTDQTTWAFNNGSTQIGRNPALCLLTYILGWRIDGKLVWGMGIPINRINIDSFILYANLCEEQIEELDGSFGPRYTCDGIFATSDSHETIINTICLCMSTAIMVDVDGWYSIIEGYDDTATTAVAFGPGDILSSGVWNPAPTLSDSFNIVSGRFADPTQGYVLTTWGSVEVDPLADGIERTNTVDFGCVKRAGACQRIAKQMVVREKYSGQFTVVFGPRGFLVSVGSLISLTLPQFGFDAKLFRVISQDESIDLMFSTTLREESAEVYAWDANEETPLPTSILTTVYDPVVAEEVSGLGVTARSVDGTDSVTTVFCDVTWSPPQSLRTVSIEIQARAAGQTDWTTEVERFAEVGVGTYPFGIGVNGLGIDVQARYRMDNGAYGDWASTSLGSTPVSTINQWTAIYDAGDGTKPADGADVTADNTAKDTMAVAGTPATTVISNIAAVSAGVANAQTTITQHTSDIATLQGEVANIQTGDVDGAAASAQAAEAARDAAQQAETNATAKAAAADGSASSAIGSAAVATTQANSAGSSASAAQASSLAANGFAANAETSANLSQTYSVAASSNAVAAQSSAMLSARLGVASLNDNAVFANWPDAGGYPNNWQLIAPSGNWTHAQVAPGRFGPYAFRHSTGDGAGSVAVDLSIEQSYGSNTGLTNQGTVWVVMEACVMLVDGDLTGSGLYLSGDGGSSVFLDFANEIPVGGGTAAPGNGSANDTYTYAKLAQIDTGGGLSFYAATGSATLSGGSAIYKTLIWHKASVRMASAAEVAGQRADSNASIALAQISTNESTQASVNSAQATINTNLNAAIGDASSSISDLSSTVTTNAGAQATVNSHLQSAVDDNTSSITNLSTTISNNAQSAATQTSTLRAFASANTNLVADVTAWTIDDSGIGKVYVSTWGPYLSGYPTGVASGYQQQAHSGRVSVDANTAYTLSADLLCVPNGGSNDQLCYVQARQFDSAGNLIGDLCATNSASNNNFSDANPTRQNFWTTATTASNAVAVEIEFWAKTDDGQNYPVVGLRQVKFERGNLPTAYTTEGQIVSLAASINTTEGAVVDLQGKTGAYWQTTAVAGNGRAQLSIYADANGGGGVDIVGDVAISGNLLVGGSINWDHLDIYDFGRNASASWNGSLTASGGNSVAIPVNLNMGAIHPSGYFTATIGLSISSNVGATNTTLNGKPYSLQYVDDAGIVLKITDQQGNIYNFRPTSQTYAFNGTYSVEATVVATSDFTGAFTATLTSGNTDTGVVNDGDNYYRRISATYTVTVLNVNIRWASI